MDDSKYSMSKPGVQVLQARVILWLLLILSGSSSVADADSPADVLSQQLGSVSSFSAGFSQISIDSRGRELNSSTGQIRVRRPNKLRWHVDPPQEQLLVSDGQLMWFFDPDLEQVTIRKSVSSIDRVPALILAGGDGAIQDEFNVELEQSGDVQNYTLFPRREATEFRQIRLQLVSGQVQMLSITDAFNQRLDIQFDSVVINQELKPDTFIFNVPDGVDVLEDY